jgi:atypical dual specificity phosphatase
MKKLSRYIIAPEFHRIPHFNKEISKATHDDIVLDCPVEFPFTGYVQEKIDGANMGVSFNDGPILRNREHILKKGYSKIRTNAKKQFTSAWNWLHNHENDIRKIEEIWQSPITIYGDWMFYQHSLHYDKLPDLFVAYDIWSVEDDKYLSPIVVDKLLSQTKIKYIKPQVCIFNSIDDIIELSEKDSDYRNGIREGIVIKTIDGDFLKDSFKVVNKQFKLREDFNTADAIKNKVIC